MSWNPVIHRDPWNNAAREVSNLIEMGVYELTKLEENLVQNTPTHGVADNAKKQEIENILISIDKVQKHFQFCISAIARHLTSTMHQKVSLEIDLLPRAARTLSSLCESYLAELRISSLTAHGISNKNFVNTSAAFDNFLDSFENDDEKEIELMQTIVLTKSKKPSTGSSNTH